jgi:exonuclease III
MKPKLLSWNVRGLNEGEKCLGIRNLLRKWKLGVICLQEPRWRLCPIVLCIAYGIAIM